MKTDPNLIHYGSKSEYLQGRAASQAAKGAGTAKELATKPSAAPLDKVEISEEAKGLSEVKEKVSDKAKETKDAGKSLVKDAGQALSRALKTPNLPFGLPSSSPAPEVKGVNEVKERLKQEAEKSGILFFKGLSLNPFEGDRHGLAMMNQGLKGSQLMSWGDVDRAVEMIKELPEDESVVLVGHGLGGDTAVEVANRLNRAENGFRKVDLLVTMDSIGFDNDLIPQNVVSNYNVVSDQDYFFNDGPNMARNQKMTKVENELRVETHDQIPESPEIQFEIFDRINAVKSAAKTIKQLAAKIPSGSPTDS
jgi:hypothetical protein